MLIDSAYRSHGVLQECPEPPLSLCPGQNGRGPPYHQKDVIKVPGGGGGYRSGQSLLTNLAWELNLVVQKVELKRNVIGKH